MIKKLIVTTVLTLTASSAAFSSPKPIYKGEVIQQKYATPCLPFCVPLYLVDGFYMGVGAGYTVFGLNENLTTSQIPGVSFNPSLSSKGWVNGQLFGGYGQYFDRLYFGGEVFVQTARASTDFDVVTTVANYHLDLVARNSLGAAILPGLRMNRTTLFYGRVGYKRTFFSVRETGASSLGTFNTRSTLWVNALEYGLGLESTFSPYFSARAEYTYSAYSSFDTDLSAKISPNNHQFSAGVIYHFNY